MIDLYIDDLIPRSKGRPRMSRWGNTYTPKKTRDYELAIKTRYEEAALKNGWQTISNHCDVHLDFHLRHKRKLDLDNLAKAVLDSLNKVAYVDDSLIDRLVLSKHIGCARDMIRIQIIDRGTDEYMCIFNGSV